MTYLPTMGAIAASHFVTKSGVCKPTDFETLDTFKELQYQLDRLAQGMGAAKIAIDGDIGPATAKLVAKTGPWMMVDSSSCPSIAANADTIASVAKGRADSLGVPDKITTPATLSTPSIVSPSGSSIAAPPSPPMGAGASLSETFKSMGTATMLMLGASAVGLGYYLTKHQKKGRR